MSALVAGLLAGYAIAMPPGAVATLIVQTGLRHGFRRAAAAGLGAASVDLAYGTLALVLGAAVATALADAVRPLRLVTAVALVGIGLLGMRAAGRDAAEAGADVSPPGIRGTYLRFVGITLVNPATLGYFAAIAIGLGGTATDGAALFVAGVFLSSASWQLMLASLGGTLHGRLGPRAHGALVVGGNLIVIGLGLGIGASTLGR